MQGQASGAAEVEPKSRSAKKEKAGSPKHSKNNRDRAVHPGQDGAKGKNAHPVANPVGRSTAPAPAPATAPAAEPLAVPAGGAMPVELVRRSPDVRLPRPPAPVMAEIGLGPRGAPGDAGGRTRIASAASTASAATAPASASASASPVLSVPAGPAGGLSACLKDAGGTAAGPSSPVHNGRTAGGSTSGVVQQSERASATSSVCEEDDYEWEPLPAEAMLTDDGFGWEQLPIDAAHGWETAEDKKRSRRAGGRKDAVHLKHVSGESPLSSSPHKNGQGGQSTAAGTATGFGLPISLSSSEEGHSSNQTLHVFDEDWSSASAGSAEDGQPRSISGAASPPLSVPSAASGSGVGKGSPAPPRRQQGHKGAKSGSVGSSSSAGHQSGSAERRARGGLKEVSDAGSINLQDGSSRVARAIAAIDLDVVVRAFLLVASKTEAALRLPCNALARRTPRTQTFLATHGTGTGMQLCFAAVMMLLLLLSPTTHLPPALADVSVSRWLEAPLGLLFLLQLTQVDFGTKLWVLLSPGGAHTSRNA